MPATKGRGTGKRQVLAFGEILWDLLPSGPALGGAPFNFACRIHSLGEAVGFVSRVGEDDLGREAARQLRELGLRDEWLQWDPALPTGAVEVQVAADGSPDFTILPNRAYDAIELTPALARLAEKADCFCFGTLIQRSPRSRETLYQLLEAARGAVRLLDVNLRRGCYTRETVEASLKRATLLKLNEEEIETVARIAGVPATPPDRFARAILERADLEGCVVTLGPRGALAVSRSEGPVYEPGRKVKVVDTCGAGDAFTAGFAHGWLVGEPLAVCCALGNVLGALAAAVPGGTAPIPAERLQESLSDRAGDRNIDPRFAPLRADIP